MWILGLKGLEEISVLWRFQNVGSEFRFSDKCGVLQEDQVSVPVPIDPRVHRRLIGMKGRAIRKFMDTYKVDIRFPSLNTSDPVVISGQADNVEEARDQLLLLEEEYVRIKLFNIIITCLTLSFVVVANLNVFIKIITNIWNRVKGLPKRFHLNSYIVGFRLQTRISELRTI